MELFVFLFLLLVAGLGDEQGIKRKTFCKVAVKVKKN